MPLFNHTDDAAGTRKLQHAVTPSKIMPELNEVAERSRLRVTTAALNTGA